MKTVLSTTHKFKLPSGDTISFTNLRPEDVAYLESIENAVTSEREKLAHWMMKRGYATGHGDTMEDLLRELAWQMDERIKKAAEIGRGME